MLHLHDITTSYLHWAIQQIPLRLTNCKPKGWEKSINNTELLLSHPIVSVNAQTYSETFRAIFGTRGSAHACNSSMPPHRHQFRAGTVHIHWVSVQRRHYHTNDYFTQHKYKCFFSKIMPIICNTLSEHFYSWPTTALYRGILMDIGGYPTADITSNMLTGVYNRPIIRENGGLSKSLVSTDFHM